MATIRGIELASDIYDLQDTQGRSATQTAQNTATQAQELAEDNESSIGTLANLNTTAKNNLVSAINEVNGKADGTTKTINTLPSGYTGSFDALFMVVHRNGNSVTVTGYAHATTQSVLRCSLDIPRVVSNIIAPLASVNTSAGGLLDCELEGKELILAANAAGNCRFSGSYVTDE